MRYRGKRIDNGELVFGNLYHYIPTIGDFEIYVIICGGEHTPESGVVFGKRHEVIKESVSIYFGRKDKNGKDIYTTDRVMYRGKEYEVRYFENYAAFGLYDEKHKRPLGRSGSSTKYEPYFMNDYHCKQMEIL